MTRAHVHTLAAPALFHMRAPRRLRRDLIALARELGVKNCTVIEGKGSHLKLYIEGRFICTVAANYHEPAHALVFARQQLTRALSRE